MDMERGPRYEAYAELREKKLRMKYIRQQQREEEESEELEPKLLIPTPPRKQVKFQGGSRRKGSSVLAHSVPDFSAVLRKENRKPVVNVLPSVMELTPPSKSFSKGGSGLLSSSRGSKSANAGEKKKRGGGVLMARKSYATIDELKSFSSATANAINGEGRGVGGGRNGRVVGRTVLGYRQF